MDRAKMILVIFLAVSIIIVLATKGFEWIKKNDNILDLSAVVSAIKFDFSPAKFNINSINPTPR